MKIEAEKFPGYLSFVHSQTNSAQLTESLEACYTAAMAGEARIFASQQGPNGEIWPPRKSGGTHPLLDLTGELRGAATGGAGSVKRIDGRELTFGVEIGGDGSRRGAAVHQYGATIFPKVKKFLAFMVNGVLVLARKVVIPARPYVGLDQQAREDCAAAIAVHGRREVFGEGA